MKKENFSLPAILRMAVGAGIVFYVLFAMPTGWLYDWGAGEGSGQGQKPNAAVQLLQHQEDIQASFVAQAPVTVTGNALVACPLARLRDTRQAGVHYHHNDGVKRQANVSEYLYAGYPIPAWQRMMQSLVGGYYNRYYLLKLADGSWLGVYFDDYLALSGAGDYPTGYIRYTTTEERRMLNQMATDYEVDTVYLLDMYRYGKASWLVDVTLRLMALAIAGALVWAIRKRWRRKTVEEATYGR